MGDKSTGESGSGAVIALAARGVRHLVSLQLVTRALAFLLDVLVIRRVDRAVAGTSGVQLQLVLALSLSLSRDVARRLYARISFVSLLCCCSDSLLHHHFTTPNTEKRRTVLL